MYINGILSEATKVNIGSSTRKCSKTHAILNYADKSYLYYAINNLSYYITYKYVLLHLYLFKKQIN